jgi:hypothetical protein
VTTQWLELMTLPDGTRIQAGIPTAAGTEQPVGPWYRVHAHHGKVSEFTTMVSMLEYLRDHYEL